MKQETKHTPGPWIVSQSPTRVKDRSGLSGRFFKSVKTKYGIGGNIVANAFGGSGIITDKGREEAEANAEFIVKMCVDVRTRIK